MTIPFHPLADIFPLIDGDDFDALVADIAANGVRDPIVLHGGMVLDGRNRYRALLELQKTGELRGGGWGAYEGEPVTDDDLEADTSLPWFEGYSPSLNGDPLAFVISKNLKRRHLNESQRAMVAARLANMGQGRPTQSPEKPANLPVKQPDAAAQLNVSERLVRSAKAVQEHGTPELQRAVDQGKLAVSAAAQAAKLDPEKQRAIAQEAEAGHDNVVRNAIKQEMRAEKETALGEKQRTLPDKRYGVIYADPEWRFEPYSRETGMDRAPENHYPTSATDAICARPVEKIAAKDSVCFLWATAPMISDALDVLRAWSFEYKTQFVWVKDKIGTGYWNRNKHEILLVGTRGNVPAPAPGTQWPSVIEAPVGAHSQKPDKFYELIEAYFPTLPKIELNARRKRDGWDAWGNEVEEAA